MSRELHQVYFFEPKTKNHVNQFQLHKSPQHALFFSARFGWWLNPVKKARARSGETFRLALQLNNSAREAVQTKKKT